MAKKMADAQDTHHLAALKIVNRLRETLSKIADHAERAKHDLSRHRRSKDSHYPWPDRHWQVYGGALGGNEVAGGELCGSCDQTRAGDLTLRSIRMSWS